MLPNSPRSKENLREIIACFKNFHIIRERKLARERSSKKKSLGLPGLFLKTIEIIVYNLVFVLFKPYLAFINRS